nr:MAG TPA: hypothetical protein [Caudoviricetes sp.]
MVRIVIAAVWLPVLIYAFTARLISEIGSGLWFAWSDVRFEHSEMRRAWRSNSFNQEDWK